MHEQEQKSHIYPIKKEWSAEQIRALRLYMQRTQRQMADELEVRQQTISEWENGLHRPHRSMQRVLTMVAEQAGFKYQTRSETDNPSTSTDKD